MRIPKYKVWIKDRKEMLPVISLVDMNDEE